MRDIYRLVDQDAWYVAILTDGQSWNPVLDQEYYLQFEGFEDLVYTAKVTRVQKVDNEVLAVFLVEDPMGPMIYQLSLIHICMPAAGRCFLGFRTRAAFAAACPRRCRGHIRRRAGSRCV